MIKGDKIKLVKPMGVFTNVGEICEVTDIKEDGIICFRFGGVHLGCMSYDEYEKYFELVSEKQKRVWNEWESCSFDLVESYQIYDLDICFDNDVSDCGRLWYRDNGKCVQVQVRTDGKILRASATCHNDDAFNFQVGMKLALKRLFPKVLAYLSECEAKNM